MAIVDDDYFSSLQSASQNVFRPDALKYTTKQYNIQMKSLLSAFHWKAFRMTSVTSLLLFYLLLLDPNQQPPDDDGEFVDLRDPFKKSVKHIIWENHHRQQHLLLPWLSAISRRRFRRRLFTESSLIMAPLPFDPLLMDGFDVSIDAASLIEFVDSGHDLILSADGSASELIREIVVEYGVDFDEECFDPIVVKSGRDLIPVMVYGRNISGQEFSGMYCVVLIVQSVAALLIIFGRDVAELPLVAMARENQGKGYFQDLFTCIERLLSSMSVKHLVLPAAEKAEPMWTNKLGFSKTSNEQGELPLDYMVK